MLMCLISVAGGDSLLASGLYFSLQTAQIREGEEGEGSAEEWRWKEQFGVTGGWLYQARSSFPLVLILSECGTSHAPLFTDADGAAGRNLVLCGTFDLWQMQKLALELLNHLLKKKESDDVVCACLNELQIKSMVVLKRHFLRGLGALILIWGLKHPEHAARLFSPSE